MILRPLCAALVLAAALLAAGCSCCHKHCGPAVSSAPPCCGPAAPVPYGPGTPAAPVPVQSFAPPYAPGVIH
jgi:hypothetical protein